ncbi:MAG: xylulokinase [Sulfitobacter sp.]|jgi:xylulokinase
MSYLGIDIGTSGLRAMLLDDGGTPLATSDQAYATAHLHPGWSEQNPADWTAALERAIVQLRAMHPAFAQVRGIGVAGHMHGAVLLDRADQVLRPCIMWNDTRSHAEAHLLDAMPHMQEISGNIVFPGFTAPKLLWVQTHEPLIFAKTAKVLLPAAFINLFLTGDHVADMSDSAGTSWLDVHKREWSQTLLDYGKMHQDQMPRLVEGSEAAGVLRPELVEKWGLSGQIAVAGGAGDNAAAACGLGALEDGQGFVSLGTSGVLLLARDRCSPDPSTAVHTFCHALPDRWYQMGVMLSAADSLTWLSTVTGRSAQALTEELGDEVKTPASVQFLPYLSGERTPHNDAAIRGGFSGISHSTGRAEMCQAVLEGVSFGLRDCFEAIRATGGQVEKLYVTGGGSASRYWVKLLASILKVPLHIPDGREFGAALGAARLGMAAATSAPITEIMRPAAVTEVIDPQTNLLAGLDAAYEQFRTAYPLMKSMQAKGAA